MKKDNIIYILGTFVLVLAAILKIFHLPGAETAWPIALVSSGVVAVYMALQNMKMKKRLKEFEK
jgi:cell division protein FtsW (lipid II flippase)